MKKLARKMMSLLMAVFMVLQVILPAFATSSKAEDENPNSIKSVDKLEDDPDLDLSIKKSQEIYDKKKVEKDQDKFTIAVSIPDTNSKFRLVKRNDLKLFDDKYFETNEKASKEYWRVKDMLNDQGLDLDLEIIEDENGFKLVTKEELEKDTANQTENPYGENYSYIDFKIMDDFDFNEKGNQKLLDEDKLIFNLELLQYESLDPEFNLYEKDQEGNLKIKNQGDIFALLVNDKKSLYDTKKLEEDYNNLKSYKEEKAKTEADQKAKKEAEEKAKKEAEEKQEEAKKAQEEKAKAEKSSSNKEEKENSKEDSNKEKESKTEIKIESNETSNKEKEEKTDSNKEEKDSTKEETKSQEKKDQTKTQENKKETETQTNKTKENSQAKIQEKPEEKREKKQGLMPKLRKLFLGQEKPAQPLRAPQALRAPQTNGDLNLDGKKFTINTRFDTSNVGGPIKADQYFIIHLDEKLKVNDPSTLKPVKHNGQIIAEPEYDKIKNSIKYKIIKDINDNIQEPLSIEVDYNTTKITDDSFDNNGLMTITNRVSGLGVTNPKDLLPQKIDKNGNLAGSIIEPGRDDVIKIVDDKNGNYQVPIDITGDPVIENGEMVGINWNMRVHADQSLKTLGFMANFTTVEGSGLGEIENVLVNGTKVDASDQLEKALGIVDSKHHEFKDNIQDANYSFYTKVTNKQEKYMIDVSVYLKSKTKAGAVRFILDQGWPKEKVEEATPTRVGINNRTTIQGKFLANDKAEWTITDAISSGDEGNSGMPLEDRKLDGDQTVSSGNSAVYGLDTDENSPTYGQMVVKKAEHTTNNSLPGKETDPQGTQAVGNIAVYKLDTQLKNADQPSNYNISGVRISKFRDLYIDQVWNFPEKGMTMPGQDFIAKDNEGNELGKVHVDKGTAEETTRFVTIPNARYWDIDENSHKASKRENKIEQKFDQETVELNGKKYKYNENANYYQRDTKSQYIHNSAIEQTEQNPVTFTVVKVDSKDPTKKLAGATFKLLGDNQPSIITDSQGKATFNNVLPGTYTLTEEKAPAGYKLDQSQKTITISENGKINVNGSNIQSSGSNETKLVQHNSAPNWPDYMNAMHYGKINDKGELEFYLYLKPQSNNGAGGTNRNTRLNISIPGVNITDVKAYDVSPGYRQNVKYNMEKQSMDKYVSMLGDNVIGASNNNKIIGTPNKTDPYTGKTGYEIYFPQLRFANDWGFLVKVKANIGNKQSVSLDYDWLTNEDTANQTKLTQNVIINKASGETGENQLIVSNEEFTKSPITITKFGDTFDENGNRNRLQGAEFVLKDSKGNVIANKFTEKNGTADFGKYPPGTYRLEEAQAPDGYQKNGVYFEVVVDDQGQVTYTARFEDGIGTPEAGRDYYIEKGEETGGSNKATVTNVNQRLEYLENEPGDIGVQTGVWEAYKFESLKYHADITLSNSAPRSRFEIQFDRNLDFTQYFSDFPKIVIDGVEVADPYFDYDTNLLTYVFNEKSKGGNATASINLRGIIPDKYYAKETKTYPFTIKVAPGVAGVNGNPVLHKDINADYGPYDSGTSNSNQFYYFRDVYQKEDGKWYVTVMAYLNPMGFNYGSKTSSFNWITTDFQSDQQIARWSGKGYDPLYTLQDVKVYGTDFAAYRENEVWKNPYMPPSFGVRPEQDPNIYHLLAHQRIDPKEKLYIRENDITINYDPKEIKTSNRIDKNSPLKVTTPAAKDKGGYIIEQTYKITDIDQFNKKWRAFHMTDGNLESAFASKANVNTAIGDQAGGEIPKYYREIIGLINNQYKPGSFKLTKYDEANQGKKLPNATFELKDEKGKVIYRTSDSNGEVNFDNIAPGRYSLEETKAPNGYRLTNKKWQVTVLSDGSVRIRETSITGESKLYTGNEIKIPVANKPVGQKFRVYKKDGNGQPLPGAKFKITDPDDSTFSAEATSRPDGIVEFDATLVEGKNYILQEVEPPKGYNPLNKKWVLRVEDGKTKVYNYSKNTEIGEVEKSLLGEEGTEWVDVKNRNTSNWSDYDNRWTGWAANSKDAKHLGTRIIAINKEKKYVVQRYIINPEAKNIDATTAATIHREKPEYPNMDWYKGDEEIKIFTLEAKEGGNTDGKVTGLISDLRLASYTVTDITDTVKKTPDNSHHGETRLKLDLPKTNKPIVVDVKVPYHDENGGVGTGMDWRESDTTYWKSDFYERVSDIKTAGLVNETGGTIVGSYVSEDSLDVTNSLKTYGFKIKKVKEDKNTPIPGATFKLTGPDPSTDERFMTTGNDGMVSFNGLKPGTYTLVESQPAPGYEKKTTTWTIRVTKEGKVYIKDKSPTADPNNPSFTVSTNEKTARNNLMRRLQMAGANTELEIGDTLADITNPLRAGSAVTYDIINTISDVSKKFVKVSTNAKYLGNDEFLVRIDVKGNQNADRSDVTFDLQLHDDVTFVPNSTITWKENANDKNQVPNNPSRWHTGYDPNTKKIDVRGGAISINKGDTASIEFKVKMKSNLNVGQTGFIINSLKVYNIDCGKLAARKYDAYTIHQNAQNGTITTDPLNYQRNGQPVTFTAIPNPGYKLVGNVTVTNNNTGRDVPIRNGNTFTMPTSDVTINATFEAETYSISYTKPNGGQVSGQNNAKTGETVTVTTTPESGFKFDKLIVTDANGQEVEANGKQFTMPAGNVNVSASFTKSSYKIDYQTPQHGKVELPTSASPGDIITITATPDTGYMVDTIKVNSGQGPITVTGNTFVMPESDVVVDVTFKLKPVDKYNVIVNPSTNGSVIAEPTSQEAGKTVNLTVTPKKGYKLGTLTVKDSSGQDVEVNNNSFTMPKGDVTITATFVEDPDVMGYRVNISENIKNGSVTASPTSAKEGEKVTLTATPNEGFELGTIIVTDAQGGTIELKDNSFKMPASSVTVTATFNKADMGTEIPANGFAQITNKQTGLDLKIYKKDRYDRKLEGAIFTIRKTDEKYEKFDGDFGVKTGTSNKDGLVEFKDKDRNTIRLQKGYYLIEETAAPLGYRKANAPWKVQVVEENGQLVAKYKGPEETPQSFIEKNNSEDISIKTANGVKYATKITHIDTESRTFIQRVYIDTRGKNGTVNVQIKPKHKREEIDRPGLPPVTIKEGVKTAYRSTYKISGINGDPDKAQMIKILNDYDVSTPDVTVVNTARWRPFDWGFDEDQLNLKPGVYYIDIEGFYDTSIIDRNVTNEVLIDGNYNFIDKTGRQSKEPVKKDPYKLTAAQMPNSDLGKIDIDIEFFDGAREFQQLYNNNGNITYKAFKDENGKDEASYQGGAEALRQWIEDNYNKTRADNWANSKPAGQKYVNALGKKVYIGTTPNPYITGIITPTLENASSKISTSMNISSLYSSNQTNTVPQEGLSIENDAERYNITFSKHGKLTDTDSVEEITKRRLEGAVFKLEKRVREGIYEELEGSYVSSAFNGYFGFRGLEPGRYRLVEVQAPKGYQPIDGPLLYFSVETVSIVSQRITDPRTGENTNINDVDFYFPKNTTAYKFKDLEMRDPTDDAKIIKFKDAKNADLETTKIIDPTDSTKKTEVSLRELSIKFPGEIKDKEGKVVKDTYTLKEIQVTPTSNGYISLEYDKANGVYQYIPEKSTTEENGLLVDYVTSATAKNMGKIVNERPGKGSVTIDKLDEKGNALKGTANDKGELTAGAKFRLTNLTDGSKPIEKIVGTDGKLKFEGLKIGNYKLEEIESPDGHINTKQVWHFTVGGEGLDPYSGDIARTGRNLSDKITLETTEMKVLNPEYNTPTKEGEIYPHNGESMEFTNKFKLAENTKINPGDYFVLNISDNIDLHGIFENSVSNLDIVADGVGTIAKADYNREAGTLTYTFTKYADTYTLIDFSNKLTAFIDLYEVKTSDRAFGSQKVGFGIGEDTSQYKDIKVVYELKMQKDNNGYDYLNMTSKIVKYNQETGEFLHYFYINRDKENSRSNYFYYIPSLDVENVVITKYKLYNNNNVEAYMPESFGVNENSSNIMRSGYGVSRQSMAKGELLGLPFENGISSIDSYIVKVTGRVSGKDKSSYQAESVLQRYDYYSGKLFVDRFDGVYGFRNEATADAKLSIQAVNPSNIIKFKKVNNSNEALKGAIFQLFKKNSEENWNSYGQPITTGEDGLIEYSKLPKGEYQLKETTAPEGYVAPDGPIAEFKVDESGKVFRKEYYKDKNGQTQEKYVEEPGVVPINLVNEKEHEIVFKKVDGKDNTKVLEGAEFEVLYKQVKDSEYPKDSIKLYKDKAGTIYAFKADEVPSGYTEVEGNKLTSGKDGLVKFKVKSNGYYALKEVKAPAGYIKPRGIVKEFAVLDDKVQTEQYNTSMDVKKKTGWSMANDVFQRSYTTNMTLRFNPNHEYITYVKDKSTIKLSDLPLNSEIWDNSYNSKKPISITAYLVDGDNNKSAEKTYTLDLTNDYATNLKASKTINLYALVKELEKQTADGDIKSNKTLVLKMTSYLYLKSELDIKSNVVIGDKIKEERTFHIGTKGDDYVEHSYSFSTNGELEKEGDTYKPIQIENKKLSLPMTSGLRAWIGFTIIGLILMLLAAYYYNKKKNMGLDLEKNS